MVLRSRKFQRTAINFGGAIFGIGVFNGRIIHGIILVVIIAVLIFIQSIGKSHPRMPKGPVRSRKFVRKIRQLSTRSSWGLLARVRVVVNGNRRLSEFAPNLVGNQSNFPYIIWSIPSVGKKVFVFFIAVFPQAAVFF